MHSPLLSLERNTYGKLVLVTIDGERHEGVTPVRAFPIAAPDEGISLVGADGHEVAWIDHLNRLPAEQRTLRTRANAVERRALRGQRCRTGQPSPVHRAGA